VIVSSPVIEILHKDHLKRPNGLELIFGGCQLALPSLLAEWQSHSAKLKCKVLEPLSDAAEGMNAGNQRLPWRSPKFNCFILEPLIWYFAN
jgi:hypothetical protein